MTVASCCTIQFERTQERRERAGWVAAAVALAAAVVAGLAALNQLAALPSCAPLHRVAPRSDAAYADALMARDWEAGIASESRLGLSPGRVRTAC